MYKGAPDNESQFERLSYDERQEVYHRLNLWVKDNIATQKGNHEARLAPYAKCNSQGTHLVCPIYGMNGYDYDLNESLKETMADASAKVISEGHSGGGETIYKIQSKIVFLKSDRKGDGQRKTNGPTFTWPLFLLVADAALIYGLYYKVMF